MLRRLLNSSLGDTVGSTLDHLGTLHLPGKQKNELFRHSVEEKTQVFKDFLQALKVSEVDCIVAHSSGIYPALQLALDPALKVKCQVFFNTGGHKATVYEFLFKYYL
ncbi:uncharacterized protein TNCV_2028921 [Trichonephila clavipes]|nr:uncharacterized protein TNCV_2028921 [Trichonephila clavipes]